MVLVVAVVTLGLGRVVSPDRRPRPEPGDRHGALGHKDLPPAGRLWILAYNAACSEGKGVLVGGDGCRGRGAILILFLGGGVQG